MLLAETPCRGRQKGVVIDVSLKALAFGAMAGEWMIEEGFGGRACSSLPSGPQWWPELSQAQRRRPHIAGVFATLGEEDHAFKSGATNPNPKNLNRIFQH